MACNLKLLDYIKSENPTKVIPSGGYWSWGGGSEVKCGPFDTGQGTDPGAMVGDNPCIDVTGWAQMYYQFVYDTGKAFHYLVVNVKARPNAGCDTKIEICENDEGVNLKELLTCSPDDGGTWYILNQDGINGTIDTVNGTYTPATGDGGSTLRLMYGFGGKQEGQCCGDTCQSAAILEIKVNECGCNDLHVILRRDKNDLIADYSGCGNTLTPEYRWYKDQDLIEGETGDTINFVGYGDGDFLVKVICGDCEEQDRFFSGETCAYPEIIGTIVDDEEEPYSVALDVRHILNTDIITILHRINVTEGGYDETEITTWDLTINDLTFDVTPGYGKNVIVVTLTNSCGTIEEEIEFYKTCPDEDPGLTALITMCEGCWGSLPAIDFLGGTPDAGGAWEDVLESGQLDGDAIHFDQLNVGLWEFRYTVNQDYASCTQSASLFVEVVAPLSSGNSSATDLCHDAGLTDLLSLVPGSPDTGGEWYTDDVIDGDIDLVNGTITPAFTDIGKTITLAYSHTQETSELPAGVVLQECWLEFDGVDDYVVAQNLGDLEYHSNAMMDIEIDVSTPQFLMGNSSYLGSSSNRLASWYFRVYNSGVGAAIWSNNGNSSTTVSTTPVPTGQRIELGYEADGSTLDLTIDGSDVDSIAFGSGPTGSSPNKFHIGQAPAGTTSARFQGKLYSFQIGTETFPLNEGTGTTITGSEGTVLDIYGATWHCEGVAPCDCNTFSLLTITIVDCTPPIPCPDDSGLGIDIAESANGSPSDPLFEDMLTFTKTGTYDDAGVVDTDDIYFSNDDGATWIKADEAKDIDYYVKLSSGFQTTCSGGAGTGSQRMTAVTLSTGEDVQEGQVRSRNGNFNINWTDIESGDNLIVAGSSASLIAERYFRWDVRHVLNSGWVLHLTRTMFDRGGAGGACPNGIGGFGISFYSGNKAGKRKILIERRITYNNGCDPITIPEEFNPTLPDCPETPSGLGFTIVPPVPTGGGGWYVGSVTCNGTVPGATSDTVQVFFQAQGSPGYGNTSFACGGSYGLDLGENYVFHRIIQFADCPPIILMHNYNAPASCPTATLSCERDNANSRARATRTGTPFNLSSDYMQYRRGSGTWQAYTEGQWVSVTGTTTVTFRRVANYNNGCPQTTQTCSTTVTPPTYSLSISCSGGNTIVINAVNMPPGGVYHLYRSNVLVGSNSTGANFPVSINGDYEIRYRYNQYQYIYSNTVNCGTGGGGCTPPTVSIGACNIVNGNEMKIPFTTTNITSTSQINASVDPGSGSLVWNAATGQGTMTVVGTPGQSYDYEIIVTNQCGSDTAYRTCQVGCTSLQFDNVTCNHGTGQTTYDIITSPDTGDIPTSNGSYLSKPSSGVYRFRINQTTGTITGNHPLACTSISQSINCQCPEPVVNLSLTCNNTTLFYSFTVTNESSVTSDYYYLTVSGSNYVFANTGAGSYSGSIPKTGLAHSYDFYYTACGSTPHQTGNISCSCQHPSIVASASCSGTTVNYTFTVTNESQATSNYTILLNGSAVGTKTRNGSGTYNGTLTVPAGSNNTVQIRVNSACGGQRSSNIASANCACPPASLSISNVSCDSETQMITFDVNQTNISGLQISVNGNNVTPGSNPHQFQGNPGQNSIVVTGLDSCAGTNLSDSVSFGCDCDLPSISLSGSCNTSGLVSFSFTVTNEDRVNTTYKVIVNGSQVKTISKTSAGTYNDTWQGTAGNNYTLRIEAGNHCGTTTASNTIGTNCACPSASLAIANLSCNPSNQMLSFNLNRTNVSGLSLKVNGVTISPIPSNPISVQGQIGSNMVVATANDSCNGNTMSDSKNINCLCNNNPTVSLGSASESGGVITVPITTTNISGPGQINFTANGTNRSVSGSGNNYSVSFPAVNGTNSYSASVSNSCGSDSDSGSYNYAPCVPPTITKIGQGTTLGGAFYVDFAVTNCDSISAPGTTNFVGCSTSRAEWNPGSSVLNWSITINNGCGSDNISGSFDPCLNCNPTITSLGCEAGSYDADYVFFLDNSGSIDSIEWANFMDTVKSTINSIDQSNVNARYAIIQYSYASAGGPYASLTQNFTSNAATAKNITRWDDPGGVAYLSNTFQYMLSIYNNQLVPRSNAEKHILVFTDDFARISPYNWRDLLVNAGWNISVIKYPILGDSPTTESQFARSASVGGSYSGPLPNNGFGDPQGGAMPRRLYLQSGFTGNPIPGLVNDATTSECRLLAASGCGGGTSFSWAASGGGSIVSGQGTNTITTNGIGSYTVTIDTGNGCEVQKTYNY